MIEWLIAGLSLLGALLTLVAAIGMLRLPDFATRMHASTKAGAFGVVLLLIAVALHFGDSVVVARSLAIVVFLLMTAPIAAHVVGRAAYFVGVPLWEGTVKDELKARYDIKSHQLHSSQDQESTAPNEKSQ